MTFSTDIQHKVLLQNDPEHKDTQHNDTECSDSEHDGNQHNDTKHNGTDYNCHYNLRLDSIMVKISLSWLVLKKRNIILHFSAIFEIM